MLRNITIKSRLIFVVAFLSLMCILGAAVGLSSLYMTNEALKGNYEDRLVPMGKLDHVMRLMNMNELAFAQALTADAGALNQEVNAIDKRGNDIVHAWNAYVSGALSEQERALAKRFTDARAAYVSDGMNPALTALRAGDIEQAGTLMRTRMNMLAKPVNASMNALMQFQLDTARGEFEKSQQLYTWVRNVCLVGMLFSVLLGAAICVWLVRAIARPLADAVDIARSVAAGDLTHRIEVTSSDETGQLLQALKEMNESLVRIVSEVRGGTETIATASAEIASGNMDLSGRTETQASSLEETASSMEELTSTVKQNADSAVQANQLALSASAIAGKGGAVVSQVVATMGSINESAKKIADIISVIDSIAFQTNILALNAAVEAARAGEQGKGFAVVATEVRHLAQRSAAAAKEIKALIDDSVVKVDTGARLVDQAGATMKDIVESVKRVTDIMGEISVASKEQTDGIQQVNQAISQMDAVTQQNAALVEQAAAAAESLQDQAVNLSHVVSIFKLDGAAARPAMAPRAGATSLPTAGKSARSALSAPVEPHHIAKTRAAASDEWEEF